MDGTKSSQGSVRVIKIFRRLLILALAISVLAFTALTIVTQYLFQESPLVTWSRLLKPQIAWQKSKYTSMAPVFSAAENLLKDSDPRDVFLPAVPSPGLIGPLIWDSLLVGPQRSQALTPIPDAKLVRVGSVDEIQAALREATPGTVIAISPGEYDFTGRSVTVNRPALVSRKSVLRANVPGTVTLNFNLLEGFHVRAPNWTFENLVINGTCNRDSRCEHAFHVVGTATGTVIRNNWVQNFNAAVKVNGSSQGMPDHGVIEYNVFVNERPRDTANPVTVLDIVAASGWKVRRNFIADFAKARGDHISYGVFFKGAGENSVFENNIVRCERQHQGGTRIGFSFGGGGTSRSACRDGQCLVEHRHGIMRNNIVADCPNDVGVYLNRSADTVIHNNLIANTRGIDVRFPETQAAIVNNIVDGRILNREGGTYVEGGNLVSIVAAALNQRISGDLYVDPESGDYRPRDPSVFSDNAQPIPEAGEDMCGTSQDTDRPVIGPFRYDTQVRCESTIP